MSTDTWTFNGSANWAVKGNWSGGVIPVAGDTVLINQTLGGPYTITYNNAAATTLQAVVLSNANATLTFDAASSRTLAITTGGTGTLAVSAGTVLVGNTGATTTDIINTNTVLLSGGSIGINGRGELNIGTTTGSLGNIAEAGGSLGVSGGNLSATTFNVSGGSFSLSSGTITNSGTAAFSAGTDTISGGTFTANGISIGTAMTLNGGTLASSGGAISIANATTVTMSGGAALIGGAGGLSLGKNHAEIVGSGTVSSALTGSGSSGNASAIILASGGVLDITNAVTASTGLNLQIDSVAGSVLRFDSTEASGGGVTFNAGTVGALELNGATAVGGLSDSITGLGTATSALSVSGDNFINIQGVNVGQIRVAGSSTNKFNGSATVIDIYSDVAATTLVGAITLAVAPTATTFIDWGLDSSVNGNALGGTDLFLSTAICYAAGTLITTEQGEVAIEALSEGDMIVTLQDGQRVPMPVKWMGVRHIDLTRHPAPHAAAPIRIRAGAFGDDLPRRDLLVSPAHAIYVDGKMVPANLLINHMTIVQDLHATAVTYHHVELERHAVIFAEGLTSESYLDMGNRAFFSNAGLAMVLHPEFHVNAGLTQWEENACAPLAVDAETITPIWNELAARAEALGYVPPRFTTTQDADLYLEANGRRLRPVSVAKGRHTFMLPAGATDIVLRSRAAAPADLDPRSGDWRPLGVAVRGMTVRKGDDHIAIPADHPALTQGWHTAEQHNGNVWRWTAGNAAIPVTATSGPVMLDIDIGMMGTYVLARSDQEQRLAA